MRIMNNTISLIKPKHHDKLFMNLHKLYMFPFPALLKDNFSKNHKLIYKVGNHKIEIYHLRNWQFWNNEGVLHPC